MLRLSDAERVTRNAGPRMAGWIHGARPSDFDAQWLTFWTPPQSQGGEAARCLCATGHERGRFTPVLLTPPARVSEAKDDNHGGDAAASSRGDAAAAAGIKGGGSRAATEEETENTRAGRAALAG